jgi:putative tryptophan/tyrosine transport system ATP-binding protein
MLSVQNISKTFNKGTVNQNNVYKGLSVGVEEGDFITIIGSNGAGKSTLLNVISGVIPLDSGKIFLDDKDITKYPEYKRTRDISRVFQNPSMGVAPSMTILENMSMAYNKGRVYGLGRGVNKKNTDYFKEQLSKLELGLENKMNEKVGLLSGGQRQSLSLIMATMLHPKLLLLDEHTAALDPKTSAKIIKITNELVMENNITTMMVTHDLNHVTTLGNRVIMMHAGEIILDIRGKQKSELTIEKLLDHFDNANVMLSDRTLLST